MRLDQAEQEHENMVLVGTIEVAAMKQCDLVKWYFDYQSARWASAAAPPPEGGMQWNPVL